MLYEFPNDQRVTNIVKASARIDAVVQAEPLVLDLLKLAASQECRSRRWQMYEILKQACSQYVGWDAKDRSLQDSYAYEQVMEALDILLPMPEIEYETMEDLNREVALQQLRDAVIQVCPTLKLRGNE